MGVCVSAAASCHAASRLFGESESVISPDPTLRGRLAPPHHLPWTPTVKRTGHWYTHALTHANSPLAFQSHLRPRWAPLLYKGHISLVIRVRVSKTQRVSHLTGWMIIRSNLELAPLEILQEVCHKETTLWKMAYHANMRCNCKSDSTPQPHAVMSTRHCLNDSNEIDANSPSMNDRSYECVCREWDMMGVWVCAHFGCCLRARLVAVLEWGV